MEKKLNQLWHDVETWRFIAMVLLGVTVGLFFMANTTINSMVEITNDARLEVYKMKYPPVEKTYELNLSDFEGVTWEK